MRKISQLKEQLIKISGDVHRISRRLHPTILDDLGLVRAIESECIALNMLREGLKIQFKKKNIPDKIPNDIALCFYRIVQEGLKNFMRHSGASRCEIKLKGGDDVLYLTLQDDGIGFDPAEVRSKPGLGLTSMRERVQFVCGVFSIDTRIGQGTTLKVSVPLPKGVL